MKHLVQNSFFSNQHKISEFESIINDNITETIFLKRRSIKNNDSNKLVSDKSKAHC